MAYFQTSSIYEQRTLDKLEHNRACMQRLTGGENFLPFGLGNDGELVGLEYGERYVVSILAEPGSGKSWLAAQIAECDAFAHPERAFVIADKQREYPQHYLPAKHLHSFWRENGFVPLGLQGLIPLLPSIAPDSPDLPASVRRFPINLEQFWNGVLPELQKDVWMYLMGVDADKSDSYYQAADHLFTRRVVVPEQLLDQNEKYATSLGAQRQSNLVSHAFTRQLKALVRSNAFTGEPLDLLRVMNPGEGQPNPVLDLLMESFVFSDANTFTWNAYMLYLTALLHSYRTRGLIQPFTVVHEEMEVGLTGSARGVIGQAITKGARGKTNYLFVTQSPQLVPAELRATILSFSDCVLVTGLRHNQWLDDLVEAGYPDARWVIDTLQTKQHPYEWVMFLKNDRSATRFKPLTPFSSGLIRR